MQVEILPSKINGEVIIPSSKSVAHRAFISAYLSGQPCKVLGDFSQDDLKATLGVLENLGLKIEKIDGGLNLRRESIVADCKLDARESGSTLRFILPVLSALGVKAEIYGSERLSNRPIGELLDVLKKNGASFSQNKLPLTISGKISAGVYEIDSSISSQYITGLILALSYLDGKSEIKLLGKTVSKDYIKITLDVLNDFGVNVKEIENGYEIDGGKFNSPSEYQVEGDWSSACFFACLAALSGEVLLKGLKLDSRQGDKIVLEVLKEIGAKVEALPDGIKVSKNELKAIEFDAENYPDFVPVLAVTLALCDGVSKIKNVSRLKDKESDRVFETVNLLKTFSINAYEKDDCIIIEGGKPIGAVYNSPNDHRLSMSASVLATVASGKSQILNAECVNKSYPSFFEHLKAVGGKVNV